MKVTSYNTTKDIVVRTPVPQQTKTYKPVSHEQLIHLTLNSIDAAGFKLDKEMYSVARDGRVANGRFTISDVADSEMQLEVGWQNSYDKTLTLKFAIGTRIMICQNGCVSGDYGAFKKKHVGEIQTFTPTAIADYIKSAGDVFTRMQKERDAMKNIELTKRVKAELIGRMFVEQEIITSVQLNILAGQLQAPTHDYGAPDSAWELYNYTTFAMKQTHPSFWIDNHIKAHNFFVNESGMLTETPINQLSIFENV
tara:strand:+ start:22 stop:780 length:759 start_codon:yes stop_codon:yes gene_type:complete